MSPEIIAASPESEHLRFLLIEDNQADVELMDYHLRRAGFGFTLAVVQTAEEFARELRDDPPHIVMADYNLPAWTGMEGLEILRREGLDVPFILVTGVLGDVTAVDCIKRGATDYVLKSALTRLPLAIRNALHEKHLREQRKAAEKALEQNLQNQLRYKDEFLSHVAHEVRNPLSVIMQFTTILLDGLAGEISQRQREYEEIVLQQCRKMESMMNALLEVTRLERGTLAVQPESLSAAEAISDALDAFGETALAAGVGLSRQLPPRLPAAFADPARLRQVLSILLDNAIKFTPAGGEVAIRLRPSEQAPEFLCIEVSDSGAGIEPKRMGRIFERLYETLDDCRPSQSLGLGLYICKHLVLLQGGQIWVESELNRGSTFSFTLPIVDGRATPNDSRGQAQELQNCI